MPAQALAPLTRNCIWMNAGLVSFRLCNRDFDCEHCLFDAAMRGDLPAARARTDYGDCPAGLLPDDRLYAAGHTWIQALPGDGRVWRLGIDAFAAAVLGSVTGIAWDDADAPLDARPACRINLGFGELALVAPLPGRLVRRNLELIADPESVLRQNYGDGWILEFAVSDFTGLADLTARDAAIDRTCLDWCRFCQALAMLLLANGQAAPWTAVQNRRPVADVRTLLGPPRFLELLRRFVH